jgi:hypothetical protein
MDRSNLIQVNYQEMRSAHLTLAARGQTGEVFLSDGQVVHAALGEYVAKEPSTKCLRGMMARSFSNSISRRRVAVRSTMTIKRERALLIPAWTS